MVIAQDSIKHRNVLSRKYRFHYKEFKKYMEHFLNDVFTLKVEIKGPLFYSLHNIPTDEMMNVEFYMPVVQDSVTELQDMNFHSYFSIDNMISTLDLVNEEASTEVSYTKLLHYIEQNHLTQATPIFHIISGDQSLQYVLIKIGVSEKDMEQIWK